MKNINKKRIIFWILIIIGVLVRIYKFPYALTEINTDEIMTAVNAKTIQSEGTDINGISFPVYLRGWGGQSVVLLYIMSIFMKIFGITVFSIRLPMMLVSIISLFVMYDLVKKLTKNKVIGLIALGFLVISPWHIEQSMFALDCNMFPHFLLYSIDILYTGLMKNKKILIYISMIFFSICLYSYGIAIYFVPIFLIILVIYLIKIKQIKTKDVVICIGIFLICSLPIITMFAINLLKIDSIKIGNITIPYYEDLARTKDMIFFAKNPLNQFINNIISTVKILLFQSDGGEWNSSKLFGCTYRTSLIFAFLGIIYIILKIKKDKKENKKEEKISYYIILLWFFMSIFTGIIINGTNVNRLNTMWYILIIFASIGIYFGYEKIKYKKAYLISIIVIYLTLFISFTIYYYTYFTKIVDKSGCFSRGFYQSLNYVNNLDKTNVYYDNIINDGCLELYIDLNNDKNKEYKEVKEKEELENKIKDIKQEEIVIINSENFKNYIKKDKDVQIGEYILITK